MNSQSSAEGMDMLVQTAVLLISTGMILASGDQTLFTNHTTSAKMERFYDDTMEVWHIEEDEFRPGYLLYSDRSAFKQLNTNTQQSSTLVGQSTSHSYIEGQGTAAKFNVISGFVQVNSTFWILVDQGNHCIRGVLKHSVFGVGVQYNTSHLAGVCGESGYNNGPITKFNDPSKIINSPKRDRYFISDYGNVAVREFDLITRITVIWYSFSAAYGPVGLALASNGILYMVTSDIRWVHRIINENSALSSTGYLTSRDSLGYQDGTLSEAKFRFPQEIELLNDTLLLVADKGNSRLRLVDEENNIVTTLCDTIVDGINPDSCTIPGAQSLTVTQSGEVYVGSEQGIWKVSLFEAGEEVKLQTPSESPTDSREREGFSSPIAPTSNSREREGFSSPLTPTSNLTGSERQQSESLRQQAIIIIVPAIVGLIILILAAICVIRKLKAKQSVSLNQEEPTLAGSDDRRDFGDYEHIYSEIYEDLPPPIPLPLIKMQSYEVPLAAHNGKVSTGTKRDEGSFAQPNSTLQDCTSEEQSVYYSDVLRSPEQLSPEQDGPNIHTTELHGREINRESQTESHTNSGSAADQESKPQMEIAEDKVTDDGIYLYSDKIVYHTPRF